MMGSVIETIAEWSYSNSAFTPNARRLATDAIADTIGCMVAGIDDFSTQAVQTASFRAASVLRLRPFRY